VHILSDLFSVKFDDIAQMAPWGFASKGEHTFFFKNNDLIMLISIGFFIQLAILSILIYSIKKI